MYRAQDQNWKCRRYCTEVAYRYLTGTVSSLRVGTIQLGTMIQVQGDRGDNIPLLGGTHTVAYSTSTVPAVYRYVGCFKLRLVRSTVCSRYHLRTNI
jgi:hypothetical protein